MPPDIPIGPSGRISGQQNSTPVERLTQSAKLTSISRRATDWSTQEKLEVLQTVKLSLLLIEQIDLEGILEATREVLE